MFFLYFMFLLFFFVETLTVRETLTFQSRVRMDQTLSSADRSARVAQVIQDLGLSECQNERVEKISGGQKKRLAFACEVLTNPSILFCDEPTSGLDSYMAQNVVGVLRWASLFSD